MKIILSVLLFAGINSHASTDCLPGLSEIQNIKENSRYLHSEPVDIALKKSKFNNLNFLFSDQELTKKLKQEFKKDIKRDCQNLGDFSMQKITDTVTEQAYAVYYSQKDDCDGGNSFGFVVSRETKKVVATIEDSRVTCVEENNNEVP